MLFSGGFSQLQQLARPKERPEAHPEAGESVRAALLPIDHTDGVSDHEPLRTDGRHCLRERAAGGDDVLEEAHQLARTERAFDPLCRAVFLGFTAHDDERHSGRHCCRSCQRDPSEGRSGESHGVGLALGHGRRESLAERAEDLRLGLEAVLVEVPGRPAPGPEDEVALQQGALDDARRARRGSRAKRGASNRRESFEAGRPRLEDDRRAVGV